MEDSVFVDWIEEDVFSLGNHPVPPRVVSNASRSTNPRLPAGRVSHADGVPSAATKVVQFVAQWMAVVALVSATEEQPSIPSKPGSAAWVGEGAGAAVTEAAAFRQQQQVPVGVRFGELKAQLEAETALSASMSERVQHAAYQAIVALGKPVIPLLLADMRKEYYPWGHALRRITGESPVEASDRGWSEKVRDRWLEWGARHGYEC